MKKEKPNDTPPATEATKKPRVINMKGKNVPAMTAEDWEKLKAYARDPNNRRRYPEIRLDEEDVERVFGKK